MQMWKVSVLLFVASASVSSAQEKSSASITSISVKQTITVAGNPFPTDASVKDGFKFVETTIAISGSAPYAANLTKVFLRDSGQQYPVAGIGFPCGRFSMLKPVALKDGRLEVNESIILRDASLNIEFKHTEGGASELSIAKPPATFCLVFVTPTSMRSKSDHTTFVHSSGKL